ncbi:hypothetical protein BGZ92_005718, partial [Podila epicladia]
MVLTAGNDPPRGGTMRANTPETKSYAGAAGLGLQLPKNKFVLLNPTGPNVDSTTLRSPFPCAKPDGTHFVFHKLFPHEDTVIMAIRQRGSITGCARISHFQDTDKHVYETRFRDPNHTAMAQTTGINFGAVGSPRV